MHIQSFYHMNLLTTREKEKHPVTDRRIIFISENCQFKASYKIDATSIIKMKTEGYLDYESAKESQDHFEMLMTQLEIEGIAPPYHMHIEMKNVNGADKRCRDYIKTRLDKLFEDKIIGPSAVISPSIFIRTIGKIYQKLNPKFNYRFFKTLIEAEQYLLKVSGNEKISSIAEFNINDDEKGVFYYRSKSVSFIKKPKWQYHAKDGSVNVNITLLNNNCVFMQCIGKSNIQQISENAKVSFEISKEMNKKPLTLILDISKMEMPNIKVKRYAAEITEQTNKLWEYQYIIAPPGLKTMYQIFKLFSPKSMANSKPVNNIQEAFDHCLKTHQSNKEPENLAISERTDLKKLSKKELIEKIRKIEADQSSNNNLIFKMLSRITWDSSFEPEYIKTVDESDASFDLINCINILQNDIYSMVNELKEFNRNLELQVAHRTRQLNQQNDELIKVNRELDNFVYSVSHDLKAPLASILGLLNLMNSETDSHKKEEYYVLIKKSLSRLNNFIFDILHLSRNNRSAIEKHEINLKQMVEEVLEDIDYIEGPDKIKTEITVNSSSIFINDQKRITILLKNVLSNAFKYNLAAYRKAYVKVEAEINAVECKIVISDNGMGIAKEHQDKIFDIFYRATSKSTGTGIGLHLVKEVVNKLNGKISLESQLGEGTTFTIILPNYSWDN